MVGSNGIYLCTVVNGCHGSAPCDVRELVCSNYLASESIRRKVHQRTVNTCGQKVHSVVSCKCSTM